MPTCTCYFLDVGQGSSQFFYLKNKRAIIIDTGSYSPKNLLTLNNLISDIDVIEAFVLTHSDFDHIGNAAYFIKNYIDKINYIYFVLDRNAITETVKEFWNSISELFKGENGDINRKKFKPFDAYQEFFNETTNDVSIKLKLLYPTYSHAVDATFNNEPNNASAILQFTVGERNILITGDAPYTAFEWLNCEYGKIDVDIITVSHHGGKITTSSEQLNRLYSEIISTQKAIISVSRKNKYGHPLEEVVNCLVQNNIEVFCTQLSNDCCDDKFIPQLIENRKSEDTKVLKCFSNHMPCAGTIVANISEDNITIENLQTIRNNISALESITGSKPLCKRII